ncbi:MAG: L-fucose/L-arabinose isomerase family protein [Christensenellales bacterium]
MEKTKMTFAVYFGNRGFFPGELIGAARKELCEVLERNGFGVLVMDEDKTRYGAVETIEEGKAYAAFLEEHRGEFDGVIVSLPNFGDENGAYYALKDAGVPILMQAYPDEFDKMDFQHRRDALCGKLAMCNVLRQAGIKYTLTERTTESPLSKEFEKDLIDFAATCRVVKGFRSFNVGAIGARTTAFKTVRVDEIALQRHKINVETIDMSCVFAIMDSLTEEELKAKEEYYASVADFGDYPPVKLRNMARLGIAVDRLIEAYNLDTVAIRCWDELEKKYGIAPCMILGDYNEKGVFASCELDISNAVMMRALGLAADYPVMLFDVNNNYADSKDKVILFHCGPAPRSMMAEKGHIEEHQMFRKSYGEGSGVGVNVGKIASNDVTIGSFKTEDGKLCSFAAEGKLEELPDFKGFFGCGTVFCKENAEDLLRYICKQGYRHHVGITKGNWARAIKEAFENYLDIQIDVL